MLGRIEPHLGRGDGIAAQRVAGRILQQNIKRQSPANRARQFQRQRPAAQTAGNRQRRFRSARRDRVDFGQAIALEGRFLAGKAASLDRANVAIGLTHQPETVAAERVHMGIDHRDGRGHCDHRLDRVAALNEDVAPRLRRHRFCRHYWFLFGNQRRFCQIRSRHGSL